MLATFAVFLKKDKAEISLLLQNTTPHKRIRVDITA